MATVRWMGGRGWASCGIAATAAATCSSRVPVKRALGSGAEVGDADEAEAGLDDVEGVVGDAGGFAEVVAAGVDAVVVALERDAGSLLRFPEVSVLVDLALVVRGCLELGELDLLFVLGDGVFAEEREGVVVGASEGGALLFGVRAVGAHRVELGALRSAAEELERDFVAVAPKTDVLVGGFGVLERTDALVAGVFERVVASDEGDEAFVDDVVRVDVARERVCFTPGLLHRRRTRRRGLHQWGRRS